MTEEDGDIELKCDTLALVISDWERRRLRMRFSKWKNVVDVHRSLAGCKLVRGEVSQEDVSNHLSNEFEYWVEFKK